MADRRARGGTLVVGGGFAGASVARLVGERGATIVSPDNFMLFTPLLPEAASGTIEPRHCVVPLRAMCPHAELLLGRATGLDTAARTVTVETDTGPVAVEYDDLVLALGAVVRTLPIPGLAEHGLGFKDLTEAIHLRNHVLRQLDHAAMAATEEERRRFLTFVFVGAGYAGVEALAELADLVDDARRYYRDVPTEPRWILVDAAPKILPQLPERLGSYATQELRRRGIDIRVSTRLERAEADSVVLSDGETVPTEAPLGNAGDKPHPLLAALGLPVDEQGRVTVDEFLRVTGVEHVWALGDGARVPNPAGDGPDPPTSQHALRQARRLARNLAGDLRPYRYRMLGQAATLGRNKGVLAGPGFRLRGFPGWFATRTYHLYQLPLLSRKLRVVTDWTVALAFPRDIAELGRLGHPEGLDV